MKESRHGSITGTKTFVTSSFFTDITKVHLITRFEMKRLGWRKWLILWEGEKTKEDS